MDNSLANQVTQPETDWRPLELYWKPVLNSRSTLHPSDTVWTAEYGDRGLFLLAKAGYWTVAHNSDFELRGEGFTSTYISMYDRVNNFGFQDYPKWLFSDSEEGEDYLGVKYMARAAEWFLRTRWLGLRSLR